MGDPTLSVPEPGYPRLCLGLAVVPTDKGLIIEGGPRRRYLSGSVATTVVPSLLPLLDGRHTLAECAAVLDLSVDEVREVVRGLDAGGLIEDGAYPAEDGPPGPVASVLSRTVSLTRKHRDHQQVLRALHNATVLVAAPAHLSDPVLRDLRSTGTGTVLQRPAASEVTEDDVLDVATSPRGLVVAWDVAGTEEAVRRLERLCRAHRVPFLRFATSDARVEIGPLFHADNTACYSCFVQSRDASPASVAVEEDEALSGVAAALVVSEILAITGLITEIGSFRRLVVLDLHETTLRRSVLTRSCPDCTVELGGEPAELADAYEWSAESPPRELWPPDDGRWGTPPAPPAPEMTAPLLPTSPRRSLPARHETPALHTSLEDIRALDGILTPRRARMPARLDAATLAGLLLRLGDGPSPDTATGERGAIGAAPLRPVDLYVAAHPSRIDGLEGSLFRYDDFAHELITVRRDAPDLAALMAGVDLPLLDSALCVLVFVGVVWRLSPVHGQLAYRVAHLEAGGAAARLAVVAAGYGFTTGFARRWDGRLPDELELFTDTETVAAVAGIYPIEVEPWH